MPSYRFHLRITLKEIKLGERARKLGKKKMRGEPKKIMGVSLKKVPLCIMKMQVHHLINSCK
jgi:hypothetical protein